MNETLTELICIIDRSGSMSRIRNQAIAGINGFLQEQAAVPGDARMTMVQFDNVYEPLHAGTPLAQVPLLNTSTYAPRGSTALLDAIGRTIDDVGRRLSKTPEPERPAHVLVAILTDGYENASTDYTGSQIRQMIEHQQTKYDWDFIYLGANQDAFAEGGAIGIKAFDTAQWDSTPQGTFAALHNMSAMVTERRATHRHRRRNHNSQPRT